MLSVNCYINSWFVNLFEIKRYILKIFKQNNARFHALIQVDLRSFVRKKETTRWRGKKKKKTELAARAQKL